MRVPPFLKRGVAILASVSALGIGIPAASLDAACSNTSDSKVRFGAGNAINQCDNPDLQVWDKGDNVIVTIDDSGFHPKEVVVGESPIDAHVIFVNLGTNTHSATQIPASPMWNSTAFVAMKKNDFKQGGKGNTVFDTGGIGADPGVTPQQAMTDGNFILGDFGTNGDYVYTSYPDCIAADRPIPSPTNFDCTPAILHVVDFQGSLSSLKKTLPGADYLGTSVRGSNLRPVGDPECAMLSAGNPILVPGRNQGVCLSAKRKSFETQPQGSQTKPLTGNVTVMIDDVKGFDPDNFTVTTGTSITFQNKPTNQMTHSVVLANKRLVSGLATGSDGVRNTNSGGLAPGDSWTVSLNWVAVSTIAISSDTDADTVYNVNPTGNVGGDLVFSAGVKSVCPAGQFSAVSFDQIRGAGQPCSSVAAAQDPASLTPGTVKDF
ncbi:MAG TPA: hypothetical protein VK457_24330 [Chloroflexota bacterium]|nr:hypothetical protein [Chloroflexota bacterium]